MPRTTLSARGRGRGIGAVAVAAAVALVAGCSAPSPVSESSEATAHEPLVVQLSYIKNAQFAGQYFADSEGYFEEAGFGKVDLISGPVSTTAVLLSGDALVGLGSPSAVAAAIANDDAPLRIIGTVFQSSPSALISLDAAIEEPEDLVGKKLGLQTGLQGFMDLFLAVNNVDPSTVEYVPVDFDPTPLVTGEVDAMFAFVTDEPVRLEREGHDVTEMLFSEWGVGFIADAIVTTQQNIEQNRDALKDYLKASILGWQNALDDPAGGAELAVEVYGVDLGLDLENQIRQSEIQNGLLLNSGDDRLLDVPAGLRERTVALLERLGYDVTEEGLFDLSLLDEVYEENAELLK